MAKAKANLSSQVIVVDCGIAHAAGPEDASHPTSKHCRDFLISMQRASHRLGWSSEVADEWRRHRSGFSRTWLVSMFARKLVEEIPVSPNASLRAVLSRTGLSHKASSAMLKDVHLVEAAMQSGRRVASLDEVVRQLFVELSVDFKQIQSIAWVNPDSEHDATLQWIDSGAPMEQHGRLRFWLRRKI